MLQHAPDTDFVTNTDSLSPINGNEVKHIVKINIAVNVVSSGLRWNLLPKTMAE